MPVKKLETVDEVRALLIEWTGAKNPEDLNGNETAIVESSLNTMASWFARFDGVAIYQCQALDRSQLGDRTFLSFGSPEAMLEIESASDLPAIAPNIGSNLFNLWGYCLEAYYKPSVCVGSGELIPQDSCYVDGKSWQETDGTETGVVTGFCVHCEKEDLELVDEIAHGWHLPKHEA